MKKCHLTIMRDGKYVTYFTELFSLESFVAIEIELGRETHILYSRELTVEEWDRVIDFGLNKFRFA